MRGLARGRRGVTLIELLVGMVITAVIGAAILRLIVAQAKAMDQQEAWRNARAVSRSGLNVLLSDIRMLEATGGLDPATVSGQDLTLRVPYAFGVVCSSSGGGATVSLLPVDSVMLNAPGFSGVAWRDMSTGAYTYVTSGLSLNLNGPASDCTSAGITTVPASGGSPAGRVISLSGTFSPIPPVGSLLFLYRRIRYEFRASAAVPGRNGLWRTVQGQTAQELAAPFDTSARAAFYVLNGTTAQTAVPAVLSQTRGLELRLNGSSETTPRGASGPKQAAVTTAVFFSNRPD